MKSKDTTKSFEENFKELEKLKSDLRDNRLGVDELVPRMKQALSAIKNCKQVLKETKIQLIDLEKEFSQIEEAQSAEKELESGLD